MRAPARPIECISGPTRLRIAGLLQFRSQRGIVATEADVSFVSRPLPTWTLTAALVFALVAVVGAAICAFQGLYLSESDDGVGYVFVFRGIVILGLPALALALYCAFELARQPKRTKAWSNFRRLSKKLDRVLPDVDGAQSILRSLSEGKGSCETYPISSGFRVLKYNGNSRKLTVAMRGQQEEVELYVGPEKAEVFLAHCRRSSSRLRAGREQAGAPGSTPEP